MEGKLLLTLFLAGIYVHVSEVHGTSTTRVVCYYGGWAAFKHAPNDIRPRDIDPHLCTHLNFAFALLGNNGTELVPANRRDRALYYEFTALKGQNPRLKTLLSVGGWNMGSLPFHDTVSSPENMELFANNSIKYLRTYNFDGLDVDWEYPAARGSPDSDKLGFSTLLQVLHDAFQLEGVRDNRDPLLLTVAIGPTQNRIDSSYDIDVLDKYCDYMNLMTYDFHGTWENSVNVHSALYSDIGDFNIDDIALNLLSEGASRDKIVVGVPFYGRYFLLNDTTNTAVGAPSYGGGVKTYYQICKLLNNGVQEQILSTERVPYIVYGNQWIGYDNVQSIKEKSTYVRDHHFGGVVAWALDLDDFSGACGTGMFPLTHAIVSALHGNGPHATG